ncbi:MAG: hypothetical protein MJZ65_00580 [Paludibacteraceae bacterium]|nr:hypothetical protein [Paludibacteraceae bacterium]
MKKNTLKVVLLGAFLIGACSMMQAQVSEITVPYQMGFEESDLDELSHWVLNPGPMAVRCEDAWMVGTATKNGGSQSLYISNNGDEPFFGSHPNVQYAYRDFTIAKGGYDISFDWRCMGKGLDAALYAGVAPLTSVSRDMVADWQRGIVPPAIASWCSQVGPMSGTTLWKNASVHINSNGTSTYRLFFVWSTINTDTTLAMPVGACVDNIQITSDRCTKPTKITATATCDTVFVNWEGTSTEYCLEYRRRGAKKWAVTTGIKQESAILEGLDEGLYDFRVRGVCTGDTSAFTYYNSFALFCPERHCINYVNLTDSDNVICGYGTYQNPNQTVGVVDYGSDDKFSRHTVNWEPDIYDPRTCNQLPTIPDGELASVRLGNWNSGTQGEMIEFLYTADVENAAILMLKYAIVMEDPDHGESGNPRFGLEILDEDGTLISPTCGACDFVADVKRQGSGWHVCGKAPGASSPVSWKEWTTIGLNLQEVGVKTGDVLRIRLTTKDCAWGAHFGYAYFTLGCAAAKVYGTSCGSEAKLSVSAPNGFNYKWYDKYDNFVTDNQLLSVLPSDTTTYRCHLSYKENDECGFDLYSSVRPRFPISEFGYRYEPSNCQNKVRFFNRSHIMTMFDSIVEHHYDEPCDEYEWNFGNGQVSADKNPICIFPNEGGEFDVTLTAAISEGVCLDDTTIHIVIPSIGDTLITLDSTICDGTYIVFGKWYAATEGVYPLEMKSVAGCDSVMELHLHIHPVSKIQTDSVTICYGEPLELDGQTYKNNTMSGEFHRFFVDAYNCDSTRWCWVTVKDPIAPVITMKDMEIGKPYTGEFTISGDGFNRFSYTNKGTTVYVNTADTTLTQLNGGVFDFVFYNDFDCAYHQQEIMTEPCKQMIFQRWNDVLSVVRSDSIDGLHFKSFQWMKNGKNIPDATKSYYSEDGGLDFEAQYEVRVVTMSDSAFVSCPFTPQPTEQSAALPAKRMRNQQLTIVVDGVVYNAQGIKKEED